MVHSTCRAGLTAASELATAMPRSLWQCGPHHLVRIRHAFDERLEAITPQLRHAIADGIRHVDGLGTGVDDRFEHAAEEIHFASHRVFGGELDVVGQRARETSPRRSRLARRSGLMRNFVLHGWARWR